MTDKESLIAAINAGDKMYKSLRPCSYGHVGLRRVDSGACVGCYDAKRAAIKLGRMHASHKSQTWSPTSVPVQLPEPIDGATIRRMNSILPTFVAALLRAATSGCDLTLLERHLDLAVSHAGQGKTPEQITAALLAAYLKRNL